MTVVTHERELLIVLLSVGLVNNIGIPCLVVAVVSPNCFYNLFVVAPLMSANYTYKYCALTYDTSDACVFHRLTGGAATIRHLATAISAAPASSRTMRPPSCSSA